MPAPELLTITVYVRLNADGEYEAGTTEDDANERFDVSTSSGPSRMIALTLKVPAPRPLELSATLPPEDRENGAPITLTVS